MVRRSEMMANIATVLITAVIAAILVPVCTMPDCPDAGTSGCSDFIPACDKCPDQVVMKHSHDDATSPAVVTIAQPAVSCAVLPTAEPILIAPALTAPAATASPPPLDPLGVRLTV